MSQLRLLPVRQVLFDSPKGRPGDWSEPLTLPGLDLISIARAAQIGGVERDLAVALLLERRLLLDTLAAANILAGTSESLLDTAAARERMTIGPRRLYAGYIRSLTRGAAHEFSVSPEHVALPLRLHAAASALDGSTIAAGDLPQALRWEIASASTAMFMREWGLSVTLHSLASG